MGIALFLPLALRPHSLTNFFWWYCHRLESVEPTPNILGYWTALAILADFLMVYLDFMSKYLHPPMGQMRCVQPHTSYGLFFELLPTVDHHILGSGTDRLTAEFIRGILAQKFDFTISF